MLHRVEMETEGKPCQFFLILANINLFFKIYE